MSDFTRNLVSHISFYFGKIYDIIDRGSWTAARTADWLILATDCPTSPQKVVITAIELPCSKAGDEIVKWLNDLEWWKIDPCKLPEVIEKKLTELRNVCQWRDPDDPICITIGCNTP